LIDKRFHAKLFAFRRRLGRQALLFPLCLVLYEFSTYIGNDMIQPGMLAVVEISGGQ
jgi:hypothetical protein